LTILFFAAGAVISTAQTNATATAGGQMLALPATNSSPTNAPETANVPPASAATNAPAKPAGQKITIRSNELQLDLAQRVNIFQDDVSVTGDQWKMTCERLLANLPPNGEHVTNIVAETNVVADFYDEKKQRWHATGDKAVYSYHVQDGVTNELVWLFGNPPRIEEGPDTNMMTGNVIVYNVMTKVVTSTNVTSTFWAGTNSSAGLNPMGTK